MATDSILYQLYGGQIGYKPRMGALLKRRQKFQDEHSDMLNRLKKADSLLHGEVMKLLDALVETELSEPTEMFCEGFSIGARMMIEVLMGA